ncbi:phosphatidate cytidylyltransferase [Caldisalinibacter kiritimatiensis]|uniref:Phosphatidate cytidylyltransferase n=1 Tax=Caldisalinibacter kiritimatiensis TaxID=1304284 RepID=R1AVD0_9FIRM|nr:phosphatidate cytidylyltransferase [Caldisalinibacter kiritimatiensis]EOD00612.1 Phosphatidate cytidylyltransferase [Caldisalinibacter kiritimatiensis]
MLKRIISGLVGFILLLTIVIKGGMALSISVLLLSLLGLYEFNSAVSKNGIKYVSIISYTFPFLLFLMFNIRGLGLNIQIILFIYILSILSILVLKKDLLLNDISVTLFSLLYIPFLLFHITLLDGNKLIWLVFITAFGTDTFAYFTGILFGKRKLCPELSPKKTIEGSIGGILGSLLLSLLFLKIFNIEHYVQLGILSIICSIMAQIGDLAASKIKRISNIKDYGNIMPGHGGVLDRFDSILFTAPIVYYYITYLL